VSFVKLKLFAGLFAIFLAIGAPLALSPAQADEDEAGEPENEIAEAHEGIEVEEYLAVGAGLLIAGGIAFTVGRRSGKKD
jgi:hypothetical protein